VYIIKKNILYRSLVHHAAELFTDGKYKESVGGGEFTGGGTLRSNEDVRGALCSAPGPFRGRVCHGGG